jgi:3-deoxy-D-manno-octulosonic-acid transferase
MIYNLLLIVFAIIMAPKIIWQILRYRKKGPRLRDRLGRDAPRPMGAKKRVWIHAVSLGEMKAAQPLVEHLLGKDPSTEFLLTTSTKTGLEQAEKIRASRQVRYFPLDFSWTMRRWVEAFQPDLLIFVEGDLWPNLIRAARRWKIKIALVSGKISECSARRFVLFQRVCRDIFGALDLVCVQNEEYRDRFAALTTQPVHIGGNLKLDVFPEKVNSEQVRQKFCLSADQTVITISCTHAPEEKDLLLAIRPLWDRIPDLVIFLAPRHPERFESAANELCRMKIPFSRWGSGRVQEQVILVDAMGCLPQCYCVSAAVVMGGSFASKVGGHNVFEPCLYGCFVLFGPWMQTQKELAHIVLQSGAGMQAEEGSLAGCLLEGLDSLSAVKANIARLIEKNRSSTERTARLIEEIMKNSG